MLEAGFYNTVAMFRNSFTYLTETQEEWNFLVPVGSTVSQVKAILSWQITNYGKQ